MADLRDVAEFPREIAQLRRLRASFDDIAGRLGLSRDQVIALYRELLDSATALDTRQHSAEEIALADDAIRDLMAIARNHDPSARTSVEAWNAIRAWSEHKARLTGLFDKQQPDAQPTGRLHALRQARPS